MATPLRAALARPQRAHALAAPRHSLSVAVVGAGAAGLISAHELLAAGHRVTVYERADALGGVWHYTEEADEPLGHLGMHGAMYAGLRVNLCRQVMGLPSFPFDASFPGSRDPRQFCSHREVQRYLKAFAHEHDLLRHVHFCTEVQRVAPAAASSASTTEVFEAVVVANGHYNVPRVPRLRGQDVFPGLLLHSLNYRRPEPFAGKVVLLLGAAASGLDIAEELAAGGAKQVYLCARAWENPLTGQADEQGDSNVSGGLVVKAPPVRELHADGSVTLADGRRVGGVDVVIFCTGFAYDFPFLEDAGVVGVQDNRVAPLYEHVFPPAAAPTLSFVGLPFKVVPFPQFQLQSRWIARVLAGAVPLPPRQEMEQRIAKVYAELQAAGVPNRHTHRQGDQQWAYNSWLAAQCGDPPLPDWRQQLYAACGLSRQLNAGRYRDVPLPGAQQAELAAAEEAARVWQARVAAVAPPAA